MVTLINEMITAMKTLLNAIRRNEMSLSVGLAMTLAYASSDAPGGISESGREMFRGSSDIATIQMIGNSTVAAMKMQASWRISCLVFDMPRLPAARVLTAGAAVARGMAATWVLMTGTSADLQSTGRAVSGPDDAYASNCAVALASLLVTSVIASRMKNVKMANAAATA